MPRIIVTNYVTSSCSSVFARYLLLLQLVAKATLIPLTPDLSLSLNQGTARVRVVHLIPGAGSVRVSLANNDVAITNLTYSNASSYQETDAGALPTCWCVCLTGYDGV